MAPSPPTRHDSYAWGVRDFVPRRIRHALCKSLASVIIMVSHEYGIVGQEGNTYTQELE